MRAREKVWTGEATASFADVAVNPKWKRCEEKRAVTAKYRGEERRGGVRWRGNAARLKPKGEG